MRDFLILFVHLIGIVVRLAKPGGFRSVVAESVLVRHQLLILNRGRKRAPKLRAADRIITGLCTLFIRPARLVGSAIVLKPSTLLYFLQPAEETSECKRTQVEGTRFSCWPPCCEACGRHRPRVLIIPLETRGRVEHPTAK